jgi:hypothetical protein
MYRDNSNSLRSSLCLHFGLQCPRSSCSGRRTSRGISTTRITGLQPSSIHGRATMYSYVLFPSRDVLINSSGFSGLGSRRVVATGAAGELALQRADVSEMRVTRGDGGGWVGRGMLMILCEYSKRAILERSIVQSGRKFLKLARLFTIVLLSLYSSYCIILLLVLLMQHVVAHLYYARRLI